MAGETIIILDQDLNSQWTLKTLLESENYTVIPENSVEKALTDFNEQEVSGLITEYWVGHSSAVDMIRSFKEKFPEAYVMMLTYGDIKEEEYERIIEAGTDDFFRKPMSMRKILLHLRKGLNRRQSLLRKKSEAEREPGFPKKDFPDVLPL